MGSQYIEGFMETDYDLNRVLTIHLRNNHYPPVDLHFVDDCKKAIDYYNSGQGSKAMTLCNGKRMTAYDVIEGLHLESFLNDEDEY